ncbi:MAG: site-specific integrase, partial [Clostridia bacterium]|nr:site-specific integrase [Clostridia bacterium]
MKYKQWLQQWLDDFVKPISKERTLIKYNQQITKHIRPFLGEYELDELSPQLLQRFMSNMIMRGFAYNTVKGIATIIKLSLRKAVSLNLVDYQYSDAIVLPKSREKQVQSFNKREQRIIEDHVLDRKRDHFFGVVISLYTGLRIGELLALQWSDVDFAKARVSVTKSCHDEWVDGKYRKVIGAAKTVNSERTIPLPKQLLPRLRLMKRRAKTDFVISGRGIWGAEVRSYQRMFENILKKLKIPHKGFHALRHTFSTRA